MNGREREKKEKHYKRGKKRFSCNHKVWKNASGFPNHKKCEKSNHSFREKRDPNGSPNTIRRDEPEVANNRKDRNERIPQCHESLFINRHDRVYKKGAKENS